MQNLNCCNYSTLHELSMYNQIHLQNLELSEHKLTLEILKQSFYGTQNILLLLVQHWQLRSF